MPTEHVAAAFILTLAAGLATGLGSALAAFARRTNTRFLSISLGFSAGVMVYVSFVEILAAGRVALAHDWGRRAGAWSAAIAFFGGIAVIGIIDKLVPEYENPHEAVRVEDMGRSRSPAGQAGLMRMGLMSALAISIHNFPEGLATFAAGLNNPSIGVTIAIAVALHNIPEGIAIAVPVYYATGSRRKAFTWSFLSGLAEPLGAIAGYVLLLKYFSDALLGILFSAVAGIMVFISIDELLPTARAYGEHHLAVYGMIGGMAVMAVSLILLQ